MSLEIVLLETDKVPVYQQIAEKAAHLQDLGLSLAAIGRHLKVDDKTVGKAVSWLRRIPT